MNYNYLKIKADINYQIKKLICEAYKKSDQEKKQNQIYNYLKTQKIGKGHDAILIQQKENLKNVKNRYNKLIEDKINYNSDNINKYREIINNKIINLFLLNNNEIEIKTSILCKYTLSTVFVLISLIINKEDDILLSIIKSKSSNNIDVEDEITKIRNDLDHLNNIHISDELINKFNERLELFSRNKRTTDFSNLDLTEDQIKNFDKISILKFNQHFKDDYDKEETNELRVISIEIKYDDNNYKIIYKYDNIYYCLNLINNKWKLYIYNKLFNNIIKEIKEKIKKNEYNDEDVQILLLKKDQS
jgi:hypothetical protein